MGIEGGPRSRESAPEAAAELYDPSSQAWEDVRNEALELEELCFPGKGFGEAYLRERFGDPESIIALLRKERRLIGFSCAVPDDDVEGAAYIDTTNIHPDYQGKRYVAELVAVIEQEARKRGYHYLTRNAAVENGYADKILKQYEGRILETSENDSKWGPQRYFKIAL